MLLFEEINLTNKLWSFNPFNPKISLIILLTVCDTILMMLVPLLIFFSILINLSAVYCIVIVRRNSILATQGSKRKKSLFNQPFNHVGFTYSFVILIFVRPEDAERSLEACRGKMFLGSEMDLQYWQS